MAGFLSFIFCLYYAIPTTWNSKYSVWPDFFDVKRSPSSTTIKSQFPIFWIEREYVEVNNIFLSKHQGYRDKNEMAKKFFCYYGIFLFFFAYVEIFFLKYIGIL